MNRFSLLMRSHKLLFSLVSIPFLFLVPFAASQEPKGSKDMGQAKPKSVKTFIQSQANSPLVITSVSVDSTDPNTPSFNIALVNSSTSPIRAFTIRCDTHFGKSKLSNWSLNNIRSYENAIKPGETRTITINDANYSQSPQSAILSVDFVEFLDGSRWGEDTYRSGERLNGWRAGAHAEVESILSKMRTNSLEIVLSNLQSKNSDVAFPSNVSPEYLEGFRLGIDAVRARVLHTEDKHKLDSVINELQRPIDLSDWR